MTHFTTRAAGSGGRLLRLLSGEKIIPVAMNEIGGACFVKKMPSSARPWNKSQYRLHQAARSGILRRRRIHPSRLQAMAWLSCTRRNLIRRELKERPSGGHGCIVAFTPGIDYSIEGAGSLKSCFSEEKVVLATCVEGGTIWLQSLPSPGWRTESLHTPARGRFQEREGSVLAPGKPLWRLSRMKPRSLLCLPGEAGKSSSGISAIAWRLTPGANVAQSRLGQGLQPLYTFSDKS
jgi:hypothetical protein